MLAQLERKQNTPDASQVSVKAPTEEDFSGGAVTRTVFGESMQHPATIYPLAGSALALGWTMLISASPISLGLTVGLAFAGATSFVYNFVVKGPTRAQDYIKRLRDQRRNAQLYALQALAAQCDSVGLKEVAKEARELSEAYRQLADYLKNTDQLASVDRFGSLAEDSLRQGVQTLTRALAVFKAMESIDVYSLSMELKRWQAQIVQMQPNSPQAKALQQQIDSHTRRINLYKQSQQKLAELIAESNEIETAMQTTYLELVDFGNQNLDDFLKEDGSAVHRLNQAVEAARKVEQQLRGGDDQEMEERKKKYIDLNQESQSPNNQTP
jgi:hypothetical protein